MKNILLFFAFLYSSFLIGQKSLIVPPEDVTVAFEKQYPEKTPYWCIQYGKGEDIYFEGAFNTDAKNKSFALYDRYGVFKSLKTQILINKLPLTAQNYLKENYAPKNKIKSVGKILTMIDDDNNETYIAETKKDKKKYNIVFDNEGEFIKKIEIRSL